MIREATLDDLPLLIECCVNFYKESPFKGLSFNLEKIEQTVRTLIENHEGVVYVYEDDTIRGMILGSLSRPTISDDVIATEIAWWVHKDNRNGRVAIELFKAFQQWGMANADYINMTHLPTHDLSKFYTKHGYEPVDRHYLKKVNP